MCATESRLPSGVVSFYNRVSFKIKPWQIWIYRGNKFLFSNIFEPKLTKSCGEKCHLLHEHLVIEAAIARTSGCIQAKWVAVGAAPTEVRGRKSSDSSSFTHTQKKINKKTPPGDEDEDIVCKHRTSLQMERRTYTSFSHRCSGNPASMSKSHTVTNALPHGVFDRPTT